MARPKPADAPVTTTTSGLLESFMIFHSKKSQIRRHTDSTPRA